MKIGLIAGNGQFPLIFLEKAKHKGYSVFTAAVKGESDPAIESMSSDFTWLHIGQIKKLIRFFKENGITEAVMVGAIKKTRVLRDIKPDLKAVKFLAGLSHTHDDTILVSFAKMLESEGIVIRSSTFLLPEILAVKGCWTHRRPTKSQKKDIENGFAIIKEIGKLDIGQCLVVESGTVLAVEAVDGTDATIKRGGTLGNGDAVLVKVSKPTQDLRFDVPAIGLETLKTMVESGVRTLAGEAEKTLVFDKDALVTYANTHKLSIVAV